MRQHNLLFVTSNVTKFKHSLFGSKYTPWRYQPACCASEPPLSGLQIVLHELSHQHNHNRQVQTRLVCWQQTHFQAIRRLAVLGCLPLLGCSLRFTRQHILLIITSHTNWRSASLARSNAPCLAAKTSSKLTAGSLCMRASPFCVPSHHDSKFSSGWEGPEGLTHLVWQRKRPPN